jgi:hypothetical protein
MPGHGMTSHVEEAKTSLRGASREELGGDRVGCERVGTM